MRHKALKTGGLLLGYGVPFAFLAMYGDAAFGTMWLYGLLIAGMGFLCWGTVKMRSFLALILGNLLSALVSAACVAAFLKPDWAWYFKPLTPQSMLVLISAGAFAVQLIVWLLNTRK